MFYVIEKTYNVDGVQIDSDEITRCTTEREANEIVERCYESCRMGKDKAGNDVVVWDDFSYSTFYVLAE